MSGGAVPVTWVLEADVFPSTHEAMREAIVAAGHDVLLWQDEWLSDGRWPALEGRAVVFHGSLGSADRIAGELPWRPGAFCATAAFDCTRWYPAAREWLLHETWVATTVAELVARPAAVLAGLGLAAAGAPDRVFVRPASPLKPFSGRVLATDAITLAALDHGFYFEDDQLPIIVAPVREVAREWRYVVVDGEVVAGSAYAADGRTALPDAPAGAPWRFAAQVAAQLEPPEPIFVLDVCEADGALHLLELNPFSGADLYACDRPATVAAVSRAAAHASHVRSDD